MGYASDLSNFQWSRVRFVFDPPARPGHGRRGRPPRYARRDMVNAMLYIARTGCQWRYLPSSYPPWGAVWQQWRRWIAAGVWEEAMRELSQQERRANGRQATPSMVMLDAQTVRGGRSGLTFHESGGRGGYTKGAKRSILVDYTGCPIAVRVDSARPHDLRAGRELLASELPRLPRLNTVITDRGYSSLVRVLKGRAVTHVVKRPPKPKPGAKRAFVPLRPLWMVEQCFAELGRSRRLARSFEGTEWSATGWLQVAAVSYMLTRP